MSKVKKKVLEIDYRKVNKCCTAKLSPISALAGFPLLQLLTASLGELKRSFFQCFGAKQLRKKDQISSGK